MIITVLGNRDFCHVALGNKLRPQQFHHGGFNNGIFPATSAKPDESTKCFMLDL